MILQLAGRSHSDGAEAGEFGVSISSASLGEIRRDRGTASSQLTGQPIQFCARERGRDLVDGQRQLVSLLPNLQFVEVFHRQRPPLDSTGPLSDDHVASKFPGEDRWKPSPSCLAACWLLYTMVSTASSSRATCPC